MYTLNNLGKKIADARKAHGLTQEQLAKELSVTAQAVSKWELGVGYPDISMIPAIAQVLDIPIDRLFGYCDGFQEHYQGLPFVASYGGCACYSDKEVEVICPDGIIYFTDRSAANISARTVDNYGKGEIRFLTKEDSMSRQNSVKGGKLREFERTFLDVGTIVLKTFDADILRIIPVSDGTTRVLAKGTASFVASVMANSNGKKLHIDQPRSGDKRACETFENVIEIYTHGGQQLLTLELYGKTDVTVGCDFSEIGIVVSHHADVQCQNTGLLGVSVMGGECNFVCESSDGADLYLRGTVNLSIKEARKFVSMQTVGECNVSLGKSYLDHLETNCRGFGGLEATELTVREAKLCADGDVHLTIGHIVNYSYESLHSNAQLTVRERGNQ